MPAVTQSVFEISSPHKQNIRKVHTFCIFISDECRTSMPLWRFKVRASLFVIMKYEVRNTYNVRTRVTSPYSLILSGKNRLLHFCNGDSRGVSKRDRLKNHSHS